MDDDTKTGAGRAPIWKTLTSIAERMLATLDPTASAREADACSLATDLAGLADEVYAEINRARDEGRKDVDEGRVRCEATFRAVGHTYRCELAAGHPGRHADGGLWWSDASDDASARLAQLRQESFDKGREQGLGEAHELIIQVAEGLTEAEGDAEVISRIVVALMRTAGALRSKATG